MVFGADVREQCGLGVGRGFENGERGAEAEGGRCGFIVKNVLKNFGCTGGWMNDAILPRDGLCAHGTLGFAGKSRKSAAPVADGVAMNAGCRGRIGNRSTIGQERQHLLLCLGEGRVGWWLHRRGISQTEFS